MKPTKPIDLSAPSALRRALLAGAALALAAFSPALLAGGARALDLGEQAFARQDYVRSAAAFFRRAEQGDRVAQAYLGFMYANGRGVPQDDAEAVMWLRRSAAQGYPTGQFMLGLMVDKGRGAPQDFVEAEMWLNLAASAATPAQRDYWTRIRNAVSSKLTRAERAEAQARALGWAPIAER